MPYIRHLDPGYLVAHYPKNAAPGQECVIQTFTGEHAARDARFAARKLIEHPDSPPVRVFVMLEVFHVVDTNQRRLPDDFQPVVDLLLREQSAGRGLTAATRGPPKRTPEEVMRETADVARAAESGGEVMREQG